MNKKAHRTNYPENVTQRIIECMKEEIDAELGNGTWDNITCGNCLTSDMDNQELSIATKAMVEKFDAITDEKIAYNVFSKVRHGLTHDRFKYAREKFLQFNNIDKFAESIMDDYIKDLENCMENNELFYGQPITEKVMEYIKNIPNLFYGKRYGDKIIAHAIPYNTVNYLNESDKLMKRYYFCHCQFARESIKRGAPVSKSLCYCSLGHTMVLWEAALGIKLEGDVSSSALGGDNHCEFVIYLPDEIINKYV